MSIHKAKPEHEVAYQDLTNLVRKHADKITALEMLAIAANMVGKLIALQDQRTCTREIALRTVTANIEAGNAEVIEQLGKTAGSA